MAQVKEYVHQMFAAGDPPDWKDVAGIIENICSRDEEQRKKAAPEDPKAGSLDELLDGLTATLVDVAGLSDAEFIIPDLIPRGHIISFPAPPNGGKTALMSYFSGVMSKKGYTVVYVDVDSPPDALKVRVNYAHANGFKVVAPDIKHGKSVDDVQKMLKKLAASPDIDVSGLVFVIDTLKKFADMMDKVNLKAFYALIRSISSRGATFILLSHTNKYRDQNNMLIFEGTADNRADVDDMIYLDHERDDEKQMIEITTRPDKTRAVFRPRSFIVRFGGGLLVVEECAEVLNLLSEEEKMVIKELDVILANGSEIQADVVKQLMEHTPFARDKLRVMLFDLIKKPRSRIGCTRGSKNSLNFHLLP
jgi:archaellum biogenesis ATPase FlaH